MSGLAALAPTYASGEVCRSVRAQRDPTPCNPMREIHERDA
jgi:hypothetical protein